MFNEILTKIISLLPDEVVEDVMFEHIITNLKKELEDESKIQCIQASVSPNLYHELNTLYPKFGLSMTSGEENYFYFTFFKDISLMSFNLKERNSIYVVELILTAKDIDKQRITLSIGDRLNKLEKLKEKSNGAITEDFKYDVAYYNKDGKKLENIDLELERDLKFSKYFLVPIKDAREYRLNFKKYADFLNKNRFQKQNSEYDLIANNTILTIPFSIKNLEVFIKEENDREWLGEDDEHTEYKNTGALDSIVASIEELIGDSEEVIMSKTLLESLSIYLFGISSNMLYNKGLIIKKLNQIYTLYYVHLEQDKIVGMSHELTSQEIETMINNNLDNKDLEEIKGFFGLGNIRK